MASHRDELPEGKKGNVLDRSAAPQRFEDPGMPPHSPRTTDVCLLYTSPSPRD